MGKILEKSGNFVSPEKWEPWFVLEASLASPSLDPVGQFGKEECLIDLWLNN